MPKLVKLYITHSLIGFALAAVFVAMVLYFNLGNLGHLVTHSQAGLLAVFLLWFLNGIVFASVQFGIAVMLMAEKEPRTPRGQRIDVTRPVRVQAPARAQVPRNLR